jgi:hypothetical protein
VRTSAVACGSREIRGRRASEREEEQPSSSERGQRLSDSATQQQHAEIRTAPVIGSAARCEVTRDLATTKLARRPNAGAVLGVARPLSPQLAIGIRWSAVRRTHGSTEHEAGSMEAWKQRWKLWAQAVAHQESAGQMGAPMPSQRSTECHQRWCRPSIAHFCCFHDPRNPSSVSRSTSAASPAAVFSPISPCHQSSTA